MKKLNQKRFEINVKLNDDDIKIVKILKDKYAVNMSALIKILIRKYLKELEKLENIQDD